MTTASATQPASKMICTDNVCRLNTSERVDGDVDSKEDNPSPSVAAEDEAPSTNKSSNTGDGADDATTEKDGAQESDEKNPLKNREEDGKAATRSNNKTKNNSLISKIHSQQDIDLRLQSSTTGKADDYGTPMLLLVEFKTTWCGACKRIQPLYEELASKYVDTIQCSQVICDSKNKETKKLVSKYKIGSYPVFILFDETGNQIDRWEGADTGKLQKVFEKYQIGGLKKGKGGGKKKKGGGGGKRR